MMAPVIPDCGIFSTPRQEPSLKTMMQIQDSVVLPCPTTTTTIPNTSNRHANLSLPRPTSPGTSEVTLDSGFSFGFYKSPKNMFSPTRVVSPPTNTKKYVRRRKDGINKGVGHKIKKPKLKAKEKLKGKTNMKTITKKLKKGTYTPYLPSSRSPVKKTPVDTGVKKRRTLSSPGMSLLEDEEEEFIPETKDSKFFTSKSRAAATVHIGGNIKLTAKYGDLSLKQREGGFVKKNIGRMVEDQLHRYLQKTYRSASDEKVRSLPSVQVNPRPVPTRIPTTPSPTRKTLLIQRQPHTPILKMGKEVDMGTEKEENIERNEGNAENNKKYGEMKNAEITEKKDTENSKEKNKENGDISLDGDLLDMEKLLEDWDDSSQGDDTNGLLAKSATKRPQIELEDLLPTTKKSPRKTKTTEKTGDPGSSPMRRSPRKLSNDDTLTVATTPSKRMGRRQGVFESPSKSPNQMKSCRTPTRRSPRKFNDYETPSQKMARKMTDSESPIKRMARKASENEALKMKDSEMLGKTVASREASCSSPSRGENYSTLRRTPRKLHDSGTSSRKIGKTIDSSSSLKAAQTIDSNSPFKASPRRQIQDRVNEGTEKPGKVNGGTEQVTKAQKESPKALKMFPIFDPKKRLTGQTSPPVPGKNPSRSHYKGKDASQMMIDAGQKRFGAEQCPECGIIYEVGSQEDEASHKSHHNRFLTSLKFMGWKKEHLVRNLDIQGGRIIMISRDDPEHCWRKVEEVREVVDNELGFSENRILIRDNTTVFLKVLNNRIIGILIAERITEAYRIIPQKTGTKTHTRLACCSDTPTKVWVGVSRIWVLNSNRGKGIATTLVDSMRDNMIPNYILNVDQIAFSDPTEGGMVFAEKYTKRPDFLVYRHNF